MQKSIREQLLAVAEKAKEQGNASPVMEIIEKASLSSRMAAMDVLSNDIINVYAESYPLSEKAEYSKKAVGYREELAMELEEKVKKNSWDLQDEKLVREFTMDFLRSKRLTKLIKLLESKEQAKAHVEKERKAEDGAGTEEGEKETPKSVEDFEKRGFGISTTGEKKYYTNDQSGIDVEIIDFDPGSQEVTVIFHQEAKIDSQEGGQNVVTLDSGGAVFEETMTYIEFEEMMKEYVPFRLEEETLAKDKNKVEDEGNFGIEPKKIFRDAKGRKIKILELNPFNEEKTNVQKGMVKVRVDNPESKKPGFRTYHITKLKKILEEGEFREVNTNIKVGGKGTIWKRGDQQFMVLHHDRNENERWHNVEIQYADGAKESIPLGVLKEQIDVEGWERAEKVESLFLLDEQERNTLKNVFLPYVKNHLMEIESFQWGSGYSSEQVAQLKEIEKDRFFNSTLKAKITEAELLRQEVVSDAVAMLEEEAIQMFVAINKNQAIEIEAEKQDNSQEGSLENLDEQEIKTVEDIFVPYAHSYLKDIADFGWGEGFTERLASRRAHVEKDRFWGSVLPEKMKETNFIRKEAVVSAVEFVKESVETETSKNDQSIQ